jgi:single-strand DNA-binding protein
MNVFTFSGNLGRDAEVRYTNNNDAVASFSVAVRSGYGKNEATTWINCNYWGKRGEAIAQYLKKGSQVVVSGEFTLRKWTDKQGQERESPDVNVRELTLIGSRPSEESASTESKARTNEQPGFDDLDSDIPF